LIISFHFLIAMNTATIASILKIASFLTSSKGHQKHHNRPAFILHLVIEFFDYYYLYLGN